MFDVDPVGLLTRQVLRERVAALIAETCAWAVGISDQPHYQRRSGRPVASGLTMGERAASGRLLSGEEAGRLELGDARPGSFQDALNALRADGTVYADRLDDDVLTPFVRTTCVLAAERFRLDRPAAWRELADDMGEDEADVPGVVAVAGWEAPLRIEAEHLLLAALADAPLIEVEAEGLPLSLVRAAEAATRAAVAPPVAEPAASAPSGDDLAGAVFLAEAAVRTAGLTVPVPPAQAGRLLEVLLAEGVDRDELDGVLAHLPVEPETAAKVAALAAAARQEG